MSITRKSSACGAKRGCRCQDVTKHASAYMITSIPSSECVPLYPNHIWSVDFVQDRLFRGRRYRMLTVIDEYTRQCMTVHAQFQLTSQEVLETLSECFIRYGKPKYIRSDNGSEFKAGVLQAWLRTVHVKPIYIYPGSPWENGYNERFNGTLRHEVLDPEVFYSLDEAQAVIAQWIHQYNHIRPHQSLDHRPPVPETIAPNSLSRPWYIPRGLDIPTLRL